jgi:hypothetical protein
MHSSLASLEDFFKIVREASLKERKNLEDPWDESMQATASGVDAIQLPDVDLRDPLDHYRALRTLWALSFRSKSDELTQSIHRLLRHPFGKTFQPSIAISQLLLQGFSNASMAPIQFDSGAALADIGLSWQEGRIPLLPELCQLALLWVLNEKNEAAFHLMEWLLPFLEFKTLWASEKKYDEPEFLLSAYLLFSYIGLHEKAAAYFLEAQTKFLSLCRPIDPFFLVLEMQLKKVPLQNNLLSESLFDASLGTWIYRGSELRAAISLSGYGTSLGVFIKKSVEIRAAGPQFYPLTNAAAFGIKGLHAAHVIDSSKMRGWTRSLGQNDVWMDVSIEGSKLDLKFIGVVPERKVVFALYVKAKNAQIDTLIFQSNSLQRYNGVTSSIQFNGDELLIQGSVPSKVELIPLAGKECFWGADFLFALEINPFEPVLSLQFL